MSKARKLVGVLLVLTGMAYIGVTFGPVIQGWMRADQSEMAAPMAVESGRRSVLLITVDTTRADYLGPYGNTQASTPAMDRLAQNGVVFEHAQAVAPITLPAHTTIMSGLYPTQHGVRNNGTHFVPPEIDTLAERLLQEGYRTGAFVSASVLEKVYGLDQGFEIYDDDLSSSVARFPRVVADRPADVTVDSAAAWLETVDDGENFFAWVHLYDPHAVYNPPPPYREYFPNDPYAGEIAFMDNQIGRLLSHPRIANDPSLAVVVMGDHGESLGEHGERTHAILAYESTMHIPWIMKIPGGPEGLRVERPVSQVDLLPSVIELLDLEPDPDLPGRSVFGRDFFAGGDALLYGESALPYYTYGWSKLHVYRRGDWKFIQAPTPELYDLRRDPRELTNLYQNDPGVGHDLERELGRFLEETDSAESANRMNLDSEALRRLQGLGYIAMGNVTQVDDSQRPDPKDVIHVHVGLERARAFEQDRLYDKARDTLNEVLMQDPTNLAALIDMTQVLVALGDLEEARSTLTDAMALDPSNRRVQIIMANLEVRERNFEAAHDLLDTVLASDEGDIDARIALFGLYRTEGRLAEALQALEDGVRLSPDNNRLNTLYALWVERATGQSEAALARLDAVLERDPFVANAWVARGAVLEDLGRLVDAEDAYREGLRRNPNDSHLHGRLGVFLINRHRPDPNIEMHLREAIRLSDVPPAEYQTALGAWLAENGRPGKAMEMYDQVLEYNPTHPSTRNNRAIALYRTGKAQEAVDELKQLVTEFPDFADAHNNLAALAVDSQRFDLAEVHAQRTLEINDQIPEAWNNLGLAHEVNERLDQALESYDAALRLDEKMWYARMNRGRVLRLLERPDEAATELNAVIDMVPQHPEAHLLLAEILADDLSKPEDARGHFNAFLRLVPETDERVQQVRERLSLLTVKS